MNLGKRIQLMLLTLVLAAFSNTSYGQSSRRWDVGLGGGTIETFYLSGHYQLYPSGRLGASAGLIRSFDQWVIRPWYGSGKVHFTTFSLEHSYFFKTKTRKITPFYFRQGVTYRQQEFLDYSESLYQELYTTLALGIALDFKNHLGASFDIGLSPIFWGVHNGRNMYRDSDVSERYPFIAPGVRLQFYYWKH